jgi:hypothetical protein
MDLKYERERRKTQCRLPKPEPNAEYQCRALLVAMGASEADGGKRGWWGQARPMGAVSHRAKSVVNRYHPRIPTLVGIIPLLSVYSAPSRFISPIKRLITGKVCPNPGHREGSVRTKPSPVVVVVCLIILY